MKKIFFLFFMIFNTAFILGQSNFDKGYKEGFKEGYCYEAKKAEGACYTPMVPISSPLPDVNEYWDNYSDGYKRGYKDGLNYYGNNLKNYRDTKDYGKTISTVDIAIMGGSIQSEMQKRFENNPDYYNNLKLEDKKRWVADMTYPFIAKSNKIIKREFKQKMDETKVNRKLLSNAKSNYQVNELVDGWYEIFIEFPYLYEKVNYQTLRKTFVYVKEGKITFYIDKFNSLHKVISFERSFNNQYKFKFQYPDLYESKLLDVKIFIINSKPLNKEPNYSVPSILTVYSKAEISSKLICFTVLNEKLELNQTRFLEKNDMNDIPSCKSGQGVYKFYIPKGNYEYYAFSENGLEFWKNSIIIDDSCEILNIVN